eukprot:303980-Chlamydomonas_euryale.AAC.17
MTLHGLASLTQQNLEHDVVLQLAVPASPSCSTAHVAVHACQTIDARCQVDFVEQVVAARDVAQELLQAQFARV